MSNTIDSLELEIQANSKKAVSGIDALTRSLEKLKSSTKGLGLSAVSNQIKAIGGAANGINSNSANNITGLAKAIQLLGGTKISTNIANQINAISSALQKADFSGGKAKMEGLVDALSPLASLSKTNLSSYITNIKKLPDVFNDLGKINLGAFKTKIQEVATALKPLGDEMQKVSNGFSTFPSKIQKLIKSTNQIPTSNKKAAGSFTDLFHKIKVGASVFLEAGKKIKSLIDQSSAYNEVVNLFSVSMGSYATDAFKYANEVSEVMGIDPSEWMKSQGVFMTLATGFGVASDRAATMSQNLTQLGYDLASFYNIKVGDAMDKLKSGLAGELEPLRAIGYDLSQAKLEATALKLGIDKSVSSMTQAEKAQLRYYAIMTQVTTTHGDMARTLEEPANQMRLLEAQFKMAARSIGNIFIPSLQKLLPYGIAVVKIIREVADAIALWAGYEVPEIDSSGASAISNAAKSTSTAMENATESAKELKSNMLGFDELNVINPNSGSADENASSEFDFPLPTFDAFLGNASTKKVDGIVAQIKKGFVEIKSVFLDLKEVITSIDISPITERLGEFFNTLKGQFEGLDFITPLFETLRGLLSSTVEVTELLVNTVAPVFEALNVPQIVLDALNLLAELFGTITDVVSSVSPALTTFTESLSPIVGWLGGAISEGLGFLVDLLKVIGDLFVKLEPTFTSIGESLGKIVGVVWAIIEPLASTVWEGLMSFLDDMLVAISPIVEAIMQLADVILKDLGSAFEGLAIILEPLTDFIGTVFSDIFGEILSPLLEDLTQNILPMLTDTLSNLWKKVIVPLGELIGSILTPVIQIVSELLTYLWNYVILPLSDALGGIFSEAFSGIGEILNETIIPILQGVIGYFTFIWENVLAPLTDFLWKNLAPTFESVFKEIGNIIDTVTQVFKGLIDFIVGVFTGDWNRAWKGIQGIFIGIWNGLVGIVESAINWFIRGINGLIAGVDSVVQWLGDALGQDWGSISLISEIKFDRVKVPAYAEGGFPEQGQMFIAREAGAEMVGNIGRRTAVANNEQIVTSIAGGVAEANEEQNALLREQNSLLRALLEKDSGVYIDGKHLTDSVEKYQRERGRVLIAGGVI